MSSRPRDRRVKNLILERLESKKPRPLIIAHRGDSAHAPENTLEAARLGREAGADAWELDAQLTRDGVAVVLHDDSLVRTTDVLARYPEDPRARDGYRVTDFDWEEIRTLDAGSWFVAERGGPRSAREFGSLDRLPAGRRELYSSGIIRVPTLREALELTVELDWLVNVEIKSFPDDPPGLVEAVVQAIERTGSASRVLLSSFDHRDLVRVAAMARHQHRWLPPIPLGALVDTPLASPLAYLTGTVGADTYHASARSLGSESVAYRHDPSPGSLRREDVEGLRSAGIPVLVYTVNDREPGGLADHLASLGVAGLFSDDPAGMRMLLARPGR
jgi:glycerophosphoryl diester phosphodiesterase